VFTILKNIFHALAPHVSTTFFSSTHASSYVKLHTPKLLSVVSNNLFWS